MSFVSKFFTMTSVNKSKLEYIWLDGNSPTQTIRSKTLIKRNFSGSIDDCPMWSFDGSSTSQADGSSSDCLLKPVAIFPDPDRVDGYLVMTEVLNPDGSPHKTNGRSTIDDDDDDFWFGFEQEYFFWDTKINKPLGWKNAMYNEQGQYYCSVGANNTFGRKTVESHLNQCLKAGLNIEGINAEVAVGQWEFQVGPLGPLEVSDQLWIARWLLYRIGEDYEVSATLDPKPVKGDWNGAGAHTNFSTKAMREEGGIKVIEAACEKLKNKHKEHIDAYGADNEQRLTGLHETCSIEEFRYGVSDRGASIRIPMQTSNDGYGYLEDRRPSANMDPYVVCTMLMETVCAEELVNA